MKSIKVCEYSRSRSYHDDLILQDQASGERSQDQWSSGNAGRIRTLVSLATNSSHRVIMEQKHSSPYIFETPWPMKVNFYVEPPLKKRR